VNVAFVPAGKVGVNLSGGVLTLRYKAAGPAAPAVIQLKPGPQLPPGQIATEIFTRLADTGGREGEVRVQLPATPGLTEIKEVVLTHRAEAKERAIDLTVTRVAVTPPAPAERR
jgi:hypothetical protein